MREIKFRAWLKETKEMIPVYQIDFNNGIINSESAWRTESEYILEQFTGLHDSTTWKELTEQERKDWTMKGHMPSEWRGREVYEGDIYTAFGSQKYEIRFINGAFCGGLLGGDDSIFSPLGWESPEDDEDLYLTNELFKIMKIIGNVHDNPESLGGK